jgi:2-polyprenyl-3-methyl-5-hydroxy-6-metoxy-1,4-benzoquinol methylase
MRGASKQMVKQAIRRSIGEPYVGKRLKLRWMSHRLPPMQPKTILDFGAEDATFSYWLARRYPDASITAVDVDEDVIEAVRAAQPESTRDRIAFVLGDVADQPTAAFDLVTALDVMEHIDDDAAMMRTLAERLRRPSDRARA